MEVGDIDIDLFHSEINAAEQYLREAILKSSGTRNLANKASTTIKKEKEEENNNKTNIKSNLSVGELPENNYPNNKLNTNKYSDPSDREKLISRLLSEHGSKHKNDSPNEKTSEFEESSPSSYYMQYNDDNEGSADEVTTDFHEQNENNSTMRYSRNENDFSDTLFFASDLDDNNGASPTSSRYGTAHTSQMDTSSFYPYATQLLESKTTTGATRATNKGLNKTYDYIDRSTERSENEDYPQKSIRDRKFLKTREQIIEESQKKFQQEFTFKPNTSRNSHNRSQSASIRRDSSFNNNSIHSKSDVKSSSGEVITSKSHQFSISRINAMHKSHERTLQERERRKKELERAEIAMTCTFKPQLSKGSESILRHKQMEENMTNVSAHGRGDGGSNARDMRLDVVERLHDYADQKAAHTRMVQQKLDQARQHEFSFHPSINPTTEILVQSMEHRPIYDRVGDVQREQTLSKQLLMESMEQEQQAKFRGTPEINSKSRDIIARINKYKALRGEIADDNTHTDVADRLLHEGKRQADKKLKLLQEQEAQLAKQMNSVKLCPGSEAIATMNPEIRDTDVIDRQRMHIQKVINKNNHRKQEEEIQYNNWFKPEVDEKSKEIISIKHPDRDIETPAEKFDRLSRQDAENIDINRIRREQEIYGNITFVPQIDPVSKSLGRASSVDELSKNYRGKKIKENIRRNVEEKIEEECTFRPHIESSQESFKREFIHHADNRKKNGEYSWRSGCPLMGMMDDEHDAGYVTRYQDEDPHCSINMKEPERMARNIRLHLMEKEEKRREALVARELEELQECTFQPKVKSVTPVATGPVVVRGIGRHFELRNMHFKKKEDTARKLEEAFRIKNIEKYRCPERNITEVQPFKLSEPRKARSRAAVELEEQNELNMTFAPFTVDLARRNSVRKIVNFQVNKSNQ